MANKLRRVLPLLALLGAVCFAQTTPNLKLNIPPYATPLWNVPMNANFLSLDSYLSGITPLPSNLSITGNLTVSGSVTCGSGCTGGAVTGPTSGGGLTGSTTLGLLTSCSSTQVLEWNGSSWVCATFGGTGLPSTVVYVPAGSSSATIQTVLSAASSGEEIWFSGTNTGCSLTLTVAGVRLLGLDTYGTSIQCATANAPVLTVSGSGDEVRGLTFTHITNTPTCPGGNGTSTCGDGLQIAGGASRVKVSDVHTNFDYNGIVLGYTTYSEFSNSISELNQNHGVVFVMNATNKNMQWQMSRILSEQNLGNGFDMTCPASFTSVQTPGPYISGWAVAYGNVGYGFNFSCSAATTSGISDVWISPAFASANNNSGFHIDLGPNGGRNFIGVGLYSELSGTYTGTAGFAQTSQSATNTGYGIEITSSCDNTVPPNVTGGTMWGNSYSGIITACAGTSLTNVSTHGNGAAAASAQTEAGITINAAQISVTGGFHQKGSTQTYGTYLLGGDTPSVVGVTCDSGIGTTNCVYTGSAPTNGYQQQIGQTRILTGSGAPTMNCSVGWIYFNVGAGSASVVEYVCGSTNSWTAVTVP